MHLGSAHCATVFRRGCAAREAVVRAVAVFGDILVSSFYNDVSEVRVVELVERFGCCVQDAVRYYCNV